VQVLQYFELTQSTHEPVRSNNLPPELVEHPRQSLQILGLGSRGYIDFSGAVDIAVVADRKIAEEEKVNASFRN
jgi:hypothetical protein